MTSTINTSPQLPPRPPARPRSKSWSLPSSLLCTGGIPEEEKREEEAPFFGNPVQPVLHDDTIKSIKADVRSELKTEYDEAMDLSRMRMQQLEADFLLQKQRTGDLQDQLEDKFEISDLRRGDLMTRSSCKWFMIIAIAHLIFWALYYKVRGSGDDDDLGAFVEIRRLGIYSSTYIFIFFFDLLWVVLFPDKVSCERNTDNTHVIIAAHRAYDSLKTMLPSVLKNFPANRVHVADNGFRDERTQELCENLDIHYHFNCIGNKANALLVVARKIKRDFGETVRNLVLLDDDTLLPDDFFVRHDLLQDSRVGGYCVAIGIDRSPPLNIWEIAIDYEYRSISYSFGARASCSTSPFIHGICAVYKLDLLIEQFAKNWSLPGGLPFGEDGYAGLDFRMDGYKLLQDNHNIVLTYCPRRFFPPILSGGRVQGYGASSLWKQRACRWFLSWPRQVGSETWLAFFYDAGTWYGNIQYRIYYVWWLFLNLVSVAWVPYIFYVWFKHESWTLVFILKGMLTVTGLLVATFRILVFPAKLRRGIHCLAPFSSPLLGMANSILRFFGFLFAIYWYIPFVRIGTLKVLGDEADDEELIKGDDGSEHEVVFHDAMDSDTASSLDYTGTVGDSTNNSEDDDTSLPPPPEVEHPHPLTVPIEN